MILEITWTSVLILLFTCFWARQGHLVDLGTDRYIGQKTKDIYLKIWPVFMCLVLSLCELKLFVACFWRFPVYLASLLRLNFKYLLNVSLEKWWPQIVSLLANILVLNSLLWTDLEIFFFHLVSELKAARSSWDSWSTHFFYQYFTELKTNLHCLCYICLGCFSLNHAYRLSLGLWHSHDVILGHQILKNI